MTFKDCSNEFPEEKTVPLPPEMLADFPISVQPESIHHSYAAADLFSESDLAAKKEYFGEQLGQTPGLIQEAGEPDWALAYRPTDKDPSE